MSPIHLLPQTSHVYKANLHAHTTLSDGHRTPAEVKEWYRARGYSVVAFTDHNRYHFHSELCDDDFLALAACEVDWNPTGLSPQEFSPVKTRHLNLFDLAPGRFVREKRERLPLPNFPQDDLRSANAYIAAMGRLGFIACYNHPYWSLETCRDFDGLRGLFAMEVYNHACQLLGRYGCADQAYDELLRAGQRLCCIAADDCHNDRPENDPCWDSGGGFVRLLAEELTYPAIAGALSRGDFYSSTGPELLEISLEGRRLTVRTSPVSHIYVKTRGRHCYRHLAPAGGQVADATFELAGDEGYLRVECGDGQTSAWSNAYFLDMESNFFDRPLVRF